MLLCVFKWISEPSVKRFVDLASISRTDGRSQQYGMLPGESEQSPSHTRGASPDEKNYYATGEKEPTEASR
jgi:hypothetical protein